jgi:uncharacterized repeat protein (TIGR02543 family)
VNVQVWFWTIYSCNDTGNTFYYNAGTGVTAATASQGAVSIYHSVATGEGWSTSNQTRLLNKTYTYTKGASAQTYHVYAKLSGIDILNATAYANTSYVVPAANAYKITYYANGGSGAPAAQTKAHGSAITIAGMKSTKIGHSFLGWATSATGGVTYNAGDSYTGNADLDLYAVWDPNKYTVSYNANGGSGAPANQTKVYDVNLTLSSDVPTRANYSFVGWGASKSSTTVAYSPGSVYRTNASMALYAIWSSSYTKPRITNLSATRCNADGSINVEGTYALVKFDWACDRTVTSVLIEWRHSTTVAWSSTPVSAGGTGGTVSVVVGSGGLGADYTYSVKVTVTDSVDSSNKTTVLEGIKFPIDVLANGTGVAFGKPAEHNGYMDVNYASWFRNHIYLDNSMCLRATTSTGVDIDLVELSSSNNTAIGYGGYAAQLGATNIYGNSIQMTSHHGVFVGGCRLATNKVLYTLDPPLFMNSSHSCALAEPISSQANGVVLVWSYYVDGVADNAGFNMTFIPKQFVSLHGAKGVTCLMSTATLNTFASKYVYVSDTVITGYDNNGIEAYTTSSGIITTPRAFVLRYVIGV